jgi:hypothetical protein
LFQRSKFFEGLTAALVGYVKHQAKLNEKQGDGSTLRDHLKAVEHRTKRTPAELIPPEVPRKALYLVGLFADLSQGRQNGMATNAISCTEILSWLTVTGRNLSAWELETLRKMDRGIIYG